MTNGLSLLFILMRWPAHFPLHLILNFVMVMLALGDRHELFAASRNPFAHKDENIISPVETFFFSQQTAVARTWMWILS